MLINRIKREWKIEEALIFIRALQIEAHKYNLHLALAGSVLNNNHSYNDLDIIVMDQNNDKITNYDAFLRYLNELGEFKIKTDENYQGDRSIYSLYLKDNRSIDFFLYDKKL